MLNKLMFFAAIAGAGVSTTSFACNKGETLQAINLAYEVLGKPSNCSLTLGQLGYDGGAITGIVAQVTDYFAKQGCRVDQDLLKHLNSAVPICAVEGFVRFQ